MLRLEGWTCQRAGIGAWDGHGVIGLLAWRCLDVLVDFLLGWRRLEAILVHLGRGMVYLDGRSLQLECRGSMARRG